MTNSPKGTSLWANTLIWSGAALSIAEMQTGMYMAPLGLKTGLLAILLGHVIGCALLFGAGLIGARTRKSAMETVKLSFGDKGGRIFALLNLLQLLGWTGIMIYEGALAANALLPTGQSLWAFVLGLLIILWLVLGLKRLSKLNTLAMSSLLLLTFLLSSQLWQADPLTPLFGDDISFAMALELSIAMPLSWLPLISDYTREAESPVKAAAISTIVYGLVSSWMYMIGLGAALAYGESDMAQVMIKSGLGMAGLVIILLSTVTTTFLDAYSAGVSSKSLSDRLNEKTVALTVTLCGTVGAICLPLLDFSEFLYFIGSVFAPMIAVQFADYFLFGGHPRENFSWQNLALWLIGFIIYRFLMPLDLSVGSTLPAMAITLGLCVLTKRCFVRRSYTG